MPNQSHAYLPAVFVVEACSGKLEAIYGVREKVKGEMIKAGQVRKWPLPKRPAELVWALMEPEKKQIVELQQAKEERQCKELRALANAAMRDDSSFRIYVSMDDFVLIEKYYGDE